jgi:hypothetical protein
MWPIDRPPQWVDRSQELATLRAGVEALRHGGGTAVWVEGEPGIGKSSLVVEALAGASEPDGAHRSDIGAGGEREDGAGAVVDRRGRPELWLSANTVNTHTRHLYAKLGVHSRRKAVDRARALGLLMPSARRA